MLFSVELCSLELSSCRPATCLDASCESLSCSCRSNTSRSRLGSNACRRRSGGASAPECPSAACRLADVHPLARLVRHRLLRTPYQRAGQRLARRWSACRPPLCLFRCLNVHRPTHTASLSLECKLVADVEAVQWLHSKSVDERIKQLLLIGPNYSYRLNMRLAVANDIKTLYEIKSVFLLSMS